MISMGTSSERVVMPGEKLGMEEEYLAELNTYTEGGNVYAAVYGSVEVDNGKVRVRGAGTEIRRIGKGMPVLGVVVSDIGRVLFVKLDGFRVGNYLYVASEDGKIVKREERGGYGRGRHMGSRQGGSEQETPCREGDVVLARVSHIENDTYVLDLHGPEMGIVYARCSECGSDMRYDEGSRALVCSACKHVERGKISSLYGKPYMIKSFLEKELTH